MSIVSDAMVLNLQVGVWRGYRLDKEASKAVTDGAGASEDAARVNKHLVSKEVLKPIEVAASACRSHFYERTLPWKDNGDRLLTRKLYMAFIQEHEARVRNFTAAVDDFCDRTYVAAKEQAEFRMGDLFKPDDYPSPDEIRRRFYVHLDIDAVTTAADFRVVMEQDELDRIREEMEEAQKRRIGKAMADVWGRLATTLEHFAKKMADEKEVFRDTTVTNLLEIVEILPDLNLLNDPDLERIRLDIKASLTGYEPKDLRKDLVQRSVAAVEAQRIMEDMEGFMRAFGK